MTQIQFSISAVADLQRLRDFIAVHNEEAAARVALRIRESIATRKDEENESSNCVKL